MTELTSFMLDGLFIFITGALLVMASIAILNALMFPRLRRRQTPDATPFVSILIPARNEAAIIAKTVEALMAQDYPHFEVIILDDNSTDGTGGIVRQIAGDDKRVRIVSGSALPAGWMGKSWACQQLGQLAQGDILIFTDADVQWHPQAMSAVMAQMQRTQADLFTVWPTQTTHTAAERWVIPMMSFAIQAYLPVIGTHYTPFAMFAAANGQCMAWRRDVYKQLGGHEPVANNVLDDVTLARLVKRAGYRLYMSDGNGLVGCRMYQDWPTVRDGFAKNILAGYGNSVILLGLSAVFHNVVFVLPFVLLTWALITASAQYAAWSLALIVLAILIRALTAAVTRQRLIDALAMPLSVALMTRIAWRAIAWHYSGGPRWKGRVVGANSNPSASTPPETPLATSKPASEAESASTWQQTHPSLSSEPVSGD